MCIFNQLTELLNEIFSYYILFYLVGASAEMPSVRWSRDDLIFWLESIIWFESTTSKNVGIFNIPKIAHWLCSESLSVWLCPGKTTACMLMRSFYISNRISCDVCCLVCSLCVCRLHVLLHSCSILETTDIFPEPAMAAITRRTKVEIVTVHCHKTECTRICISFSSFSLAWLCAFCLVEFEWVRMIAFTSLCFFGSNAHTIVVVSGNGCRMWVRDREHRQYINLGRISDLHHIVRTHAR